MKIVSSLLCDYATVREGLLHVLGGGVTQVRREEVPTDGLDLSIALMFAYADFADFTSAHEFSVTIVDTSSGKSVAVAKAKIVNVPMQEEMAPLPSVPAVLSLRALSLPSYSVYSVQISIDGGDVATELQFRLVSEAPETAVSGEPSETSVNSS